MRHLESGAAGRASDSRSQHDNKKEAFQRLLADPRMKFWIAKKVYEVHQGESVEQAIAKETTDDKLKYEIKNAKGQWEEVSAAYFDGETAKEESEP